MYEEQDFIAEVNIFDRVGFEGDIKGDDDYRDPEKKYFMLVETIARQLSQEGIIKISNSSIQHDLMKRIESVKSPALKNPTATVLGYYVVNSEKEIDQRRLRAIKQKLSILESPVKLTDVIRYANLWITQL